METHHILERLRTAFDPLGVLSPPNPGKTSPKIAEASSILGMADMVILLMTSRTENGNKSIGLIRSILQKDSINVRKTVF